MVEGIWINLLVNAWPILISQFQRSQEPPMDLVARWQSLHELPDPQRNSFVALPT